MTWNRELGIDDAGYTDDCYDLLPRPEKALLTQRERDSWGFQRGGSEQDWGLDDPEAFDYELPTLERSNRSAVSDLDSNLDLDDYGKDAA